MGILSFRRKTLTEVTIIPKVRSSSSEAEELQGGLPSVGTGHFSRSHLSGLHRRLVADIIILSPYKDLLYGCGFRPVGWGKFTVKANSTLVLPQCPLYALLER